MARLRSSYTRRHSSAEGGGDDDIGQGDSMVLLNPFIENRFLGQNWSENQMVF